ncbi:MAG: hypothetical protein IPM77_09665 [Crocinitomicaceae bacterium]|nr:hypothetical protein [Crocinitomicaceae bacterium]
MKTVFSIAFLSLIFSSVQAAVIPEHLILHADSVSREIEVSHRKLSQYLVSAAKSEEEKVLIFSYWIAKNIRYNLHEAKKQHRTNKTACEVLSNKKAVCEGYSILFHQFCQNSGIEAYTVYGHGLGSFIKRTFSFAHLRHAWNVVYVSNQWKVVDVTWASSEIKHGEFKEKNELKWIFTDAEEFAKTHYPNDPRWQLLKNPRSSKEFWSKSETVSEKNYPMEDSLHVLLERPRYLNEVYTCTGAFDEQNDAHIYIKNLIHLGWKYVGGTYNAEKVNQGIEIFQFAQKELERLSPVLDNILYQPNIRQGLNTAGKRIESEK